MRSQDSTERSWFKVSRFCYTLMKYSCDRRPGCRHGRNCRGGVGGVGAGECGACPQAVRRYAGPDAGDCDNARNGIAFFGCRYVIALSFQFRFGRGILGIGGGNLDEPRFRKQPSASPHRQSINPFSFHFHSQHSLHRPAISAADGLSGHRYLPLCLWPSYIPRSHSVTFRNHF